MSAGAAGLFDDWARNMTITFAGYSKAETLTQFPVLVLLQEGSNGFYAADMASSADAADLRFATADGSTELPYETETWNPGGTSYFWVKVDSLSTGTVIRAYWGKAGQSVPGYAADGTVWSQGFGGVWHLDEAAADSGRFFDSTSNRNDGVFHDANGNSGTAVPAAVGRGVHFGGDADYAEITNTATVSPVNAITLEAWVLSDNAAWTAGQYMTLAKEGSYLFGGINGGKTFAALTKNGAANQTATSPSLSSVLTWHHYVGTYDKTRMRIYVDGVDVGASNSYTAAITTNAIPLIIGARRIASPTYLDGWVDEARLSGVARSSNWVWACFMNQASNAVFATYESTYPAVDNGQGATNVLDQSADLTGTLTSTGGFATTVWAFWDTSDRTTNKTWAFSTNGVAVDVGAMTNPIAGLSPNQRYFYTYYASNSSGGSWAQPSRSFETWGPPSVDNTGGATDLWYTNATLHGKLLDGIGATVSFYWGTDPDQLTNAAVAGTIAEGSFSLPIAGLKDDTLYYYRAFASNDYGTALAAPAATFTTPVMGITWTGAGVTNLASNPTNWAGAVCPTNGDAVHFDATSCRDVIWNLSNVAVRAWNQDEGYTGSVTFATVRPGRGAFTNAVITGACAIRGGGWTHPANSGFTVEHEWLRVSVGGDFTLTSNAWISADLRGYASTRGPAPGTAVNGRGAAHGGGGGRYSSGTGAPQLNTYGSIVSPTNHGSGAAPNGGGTIVLTVGQTARIDGRISAVGGIGNASAAGGSIWITAGALAGGGLLDASGGVPASAGFNSGGPGGGRISVILTNATSFDAVRMTALGGGGNSRDTDGAAGTIYRQTRDQAPGHGTLVVSNNPARWPIPDYGNCTMMPAAGAYNGAVNLDDFAQIVIAGRGVLGVNADTTLTDFTRIAGSGGNDAYLALRYTNGVVFPQNLVVSNYTLAIDVPTRLPQDLTIASNGAASHSRSRYGEETYCLNLTIPGNLTIQAGGMVTADEFGFYGPYRTNGAASYGGRGGWTLSSSDTLTYGSVLTPTNLGCNATSAGPGGGAIRLDVAGTTTVAGAISVRGSLSGTAGGSGGSIWLKTGYLAGSGVFNANGGAGTSYGGGGGRISVMLTLSDAFGDIAMQAFGGTDSTSPYNDGAVGTIYRESASRSGGRGDLAVYGPVHSHTSFWYRVHTDLPGATNAAAAELSDVTLRALTNCTVGLTADVTLQDLYLMRDDTLLYLNGHTLTLRASRHSDWGTESRVVYDGGAIVWKAAGTVIMVR